jgi:hypothetical protein
MSDDRAIKGASVSDSEQHWLVDVPQSQGVLLAALSCERYCVCSRNVVPEETGERIADAISDIAPHLLRISPLRFIS